MKTRIFLAFSIVILAALLSNFIFYRLIMRDFDNYAGGVRDDQFYWILTSVEGSYTGNGWNKGTLSESIHWAMMLGLDIKVLNKEGKEIISSRETFASLSGIMKEHMHGIFHQHGSGGEYDQYPLYAKGYRIGTLLSRPFQKEKIREKEFIFKRRTRNFIDVSLAIAGSGALLLAFLLSRYLSKPISDLQQAAQKIAQGNFAIAIPQESNDEVGKLAAAFNKMAESLEKEEQLRKRLMSNVAHELRTPLTIMKTYAEAMADGVIDNKESGYETIRNELDKLISLVKGIEDITVAESSFFTKREMSEVNLKEFLSGIVNGITPAFIEKGIGITLSDGTDILAVVDSEKLDHIVSNILSNALKYTERGRVTVSYGTAGDSFFIEIKDTGKGIPEHELPHVFNRFYRVEQETDTGLGLGLSIVKELLDTLHGRIALQSTVNEGTTVRISLPLGVL